MLADRKPPRATTHSYHASDGARVIAAQLGTAAAVGDLEAAVGAAIDQDPGKVVIDLGSVPQMPNVAVSSLCAALRRLSRRQGGISVLNADQRTRWVLERCALDGVELGATVRSALSAPGRKARGPRSGARSTGE